MRLVGVKMALLMDTFAALMMKAMAKRMAATKPSMRAVLPSLLRLILFAADTVLLIRHLPRSRGIPPGSAASAWNGRQVPEIGALNRAPHALTVTIRALWARGCYSPARRPRSWRWHWRCRR